MRKVEWKKKGVPGLYSLKENGYTYIIQFENGGDLFGDPIAFKSSTDIGPFMREYPYLKQVWTRTLDDHIEILTDRPNSECKEYDE